LPDHACYDTLSAMSDCTDTLDSSFFEANERARITASLIRWYGTNARTFPWRETGEPYAIFIAEFMLQRTKATQVEPVYRRFMLRFPTLTVLAAAVPGEVIDLLQPLGLTGKAVILASAVDHVVQRHQGRLPRRYDDLLQIPGVGEYTARALQCFAWKRRVAVVDEGVARILVRVTGYRRAPGKIGHDKGLLTLADSFVPRRLPGLYNWAILDLAAAICTIRRPQCLACPILRWCAEGRSRTSERADDR
jgi:A/G-specific adenine glycosylase